MLPILFLLQLPDNYNFEIPKTIWRIQQAKAKRGKFKVLNFTYL